MPAARQRLEVHRSLDQWGPPDRRATQDRFHGDRQGWAHSILEVQLSHLKLLSKPLLSVEKGNSSGSKKSLLVKKMIPTTRKATKRMNSPRPLDNTTPTSHLKEGSRADLSSGDLLLKTLLSSVHPREDRDAEEGEETSRDITAAVNSLSQPTTVMLNSAEIWNPEFIITSTTYATCSAMSETGDRGGLFLPTQLHSRRLTAFITFAAWN